MRLVTAAEMKSIDRHAIEKMGIPSLLLMENAGLKILFALEKALGGLRGKRFTIVCGRGNNGGDGLVIARHLFNSRVNIDVYLACHPSELSPDASANFKMLEAAGYKCSTLRGFDELDRFRASLEFSDFAIDAIFGTGFSGQIEGFPREIVRVLNACRARRISVDLPSGLCGTTGKASMTTVKADITITLGAPKIGLFVPPGSEYSGEVWVADIGIPPASYDSVPGSATLLTQDYVSPLLPSRPEQSHKGIFGHLLILAGSTDFQGAGVLASYGALRSGTGLVTLGLPAALSREISCEILPDLILRRFGDREGGFSFGEDEIRGFSGLYRAVVAGPGWGRSPGRKIALATLMSHWPGPLLLDADGILAMQDSGITPGRGSDLVLTPHIGEMSRLCGSTIAQIQEDTVEIGRAYVKRFPCVLVLKAATTFIFAPSGHIFISNRPNSGMAKGGSGDLLAGLIGGLMAQGLGGLQAAVTGVFLHAEAGELARKELGADAMTVSEVASLIPKAFRKLRGEFTPRENGAFPGQSPAGTHPGSSGYPA